MIMNEPEKRASARPRQPLGDAVEAAFEEYYLAVGKVAQVRGTLCTNTSGSFSSPPVALTCGREQRRWVALAIWYSVKSDRAERDMLRAAVNANSGRWEKLPKALDDFNWLLDRCDELAEHRNDAVHAPCSIYIGSEPNPWMGPAYFAAGNPRVKNLGPKS